MSAITYIQLKTNIDCIRQIKTVRIIQRMNEHARLFLTAVLSNEKKDDFIEKNLCKEQVILSSNEDTQMTLFQGMILEAQTEAIGGVYYLKIKAISNSYLTDLKKVSRSFQDKKMTYEKLIKNIISDYPSGDILDLASKGKALEHLIVQYEETDWEFLKRLASHFHVGILPSVTHEGPKIIMGVPKGSSAGSMDCSSYKMVKHLDKHLKSSKNGGGQLNEADSMEYLLETEKNYTIGDQLTFQNIPLYIKSKEASMSGGILKFKYALSSQAGFYEDYIYNENIAGISLKGKVLDIKEDKLKVQLEIDDSQNKEKAWKFPYATPYAAEGHSGWYCMPERGDTVLVHFPSHKEEDAYGMNSVRVKDKDSDDFDDPDIKIFRTKNGKEIRFSPEEILITCLSGIDEITGKKQNIYIKLHQDTGIEIVSSEPIQFKSDKGIRLDAEDSIQLLASKEIRLTCKTSEILINEKIDICGEDVKIN
ncbi:contractile injection system protein, VgrG/Pvc8 family [Lacrimispora sp.]|uniref:contractile injection system protein, VgrG/Pvc8 family n=1 Tax=Lacrimispora sp. TaxID=2719234 RepID=UPI00399371A1